MSGYRGVGFHPETGKWRARVKFNGKMHDLGLHDTPEAAFAAYQIGARIHHKEFASYQPC